MKILALTVALLSGCSTVTAPSDVQVEVSVTSYDPGNETYTATIRNSGNYSVLVLHPLVVLSETPEPTISDRPSFSGDDIPMFHDNRLLPGESLKYKGSRGVANMDRNRPIYVGFYVCRFNRGWNCPKYLVKWSKTPANAT